MSQGSVVVYKKLKEAYAKLEAENAKLMSALKAVEFCRQRAGEYGPECPLCGGPKLMKGHFPDCVVGLALEAVVVRVTYERNALRAGNSMADESSAKAWAENAALTDQLREAGVDVDGFLARARERRAQHDDDERTAWLSDEVPK